MTERFEYYMYSESCHFKYAKGHPAVTGQEFHNYDEIVLVLEGNVQLISKNIQLQLIPGSVVLIPKEQFHQFLVTDSDNYVRCILGFENISHLQTLIRQVMTEVEVLLHPSAEFLSIFKTLMQAAQKEISPDEQALILPSALVQLLIDQKLSNSESIRTHVTVSVLTQDALNYIDNNLSDELHLDTIAHELGVSVSSLSHHFRKDLSISVYRYISEKRLSTVRQYIDEGVSLGTAATRSGFKDYSGFFRLYKDYYGECPSAATRTSVTSKKATKSGDGE